MRKPTTLVPLLFCALFIHVETLAHTPKTAVRKSDTIGGSVTQVASNDTVRITVTSTCRQSWCPQIGEPLVVRVKSNAPRHESPSLALQALATVSHLMSGQPLSFVPDAPPRNGTVATDLIHAGEQVAHDLANYGRSLVAPGAASGARLYDWQSDVKRSGGRMVEDAKSIVEPITRPSTMTQADVERIGDSAEGVLSRIDRMTKQLWRQHGQPLVRRMRQLVPLIDDAADEITKE